MNFYHSVCLPVFKGTVIKYKGQLKLKIDWRCYRYVIITIILILTQLIEIKINTVPSLLFINS